MVVSSSSSSSFLFLFWKGNSLDGFLRSGKRKGRVADRLYRLVQGWSRANPSEPFIRHPRSIHCRLVERRRSSSIPVSSPVNRDFSFGFQDGGRGESRILRRGWRRIYSRIIRHEGWTNSPSLPPDARFIVIEREFRRSKKGSIPISQTILFFVNDNSR